MTEISFHTNVPDRLGYTCRLLRKASRQGAKVVVTAPMATLRGLDRALWTFEPTEFVAHAVVCAGQAPPAALAPTPVWLAEQPEDVGHHDVLVNLGEPLPRGFERFARLIEIVSADDADRAAARLRWKHYANRGYTLVQHAVGNA